jgi:hypothetical protein
MNYTDSPKLMCEAFTIKVILIISNQIKVAFIVNEFLPHIYVSKL